MSAGVRAVGRTKVIEENLIVTLGCSIGDVGDDHRRGFVRCEDLLPENAFGLAGEDELNGQR